MSVLRDIDQIRSALSMPGQPFEFVDTEVNGAALPVYKNLPVNVTQIIAEAVSFGDRDLLVQGERRYSFAGLLGEAAGLAVLLSSRYGVGAGQRVAIAMANSPEWVIAFAATLLAGATAVAVNSRGTQEDMLHAILDTECTLVVADDRRAASLGENYHGAMLLAGTGTFTDRDGTVLEVVPAPVTPSKAGPDEAALILFTSGTTGRPKGAVLTHRGVCTFVFGMRHHGAAMIAHTARGLNMTAEALMAVLPPPATLGIFPLFHVSGVCATVLGALQSGIKIVLMPRWDTKQALALIASEKITMLSGPPSIFWDLLADPGLEQTDLSSLTSLAVGGQAMPQNLIEALARQFPRAGFGTGYGMTETNGSLVACMGAEFLNNIKASGRVLPGVQLRIVGEDGQDQPLGEVGEILARAAVNMAGYWNNDAANAEIFIDGWLRTGDIGFLDADRYLTIVDRKKDMVIRGGENVYCAEVERVFHEYPGIHEVAAFGVPDERWGERVVLAVVLHPHEQIAEADIRAYGAGRLAGYKQPSALFFTEPFQRNVLGKIDKRRLRTLYLEQANP
jgi:long-chain acyl-CoA synthetase